MKYRSADVMARGTGQKLSSYIPGTEANREKKENQAYGTSGYGSNTGTGTGSGYNSNTGTGSGYTGTGTGSGYNSNTGTGSGYTGTGSGYNSNTGTGSGYNSNTGTGSGYTGTGSGHNTGTSSGYTGTGSGHNNTSGTAGMTTGETLLATSLPHAMHYPCCGKACAGFRPSQSSAISAGGVDLGLPCCGCPMAVIVISFLSMQAPSLLCQLLSGLLDC